MTKGSAALPPLDLVLRWLLVSLENAANREIIQRLMQDYFAITGEWPAPSTNRAIPATPTNNPVPATPTGKRPVLRTIDVWDSPDDQNFQPPLQGLATPVMLPAQPKISKPGRYGNLTAFGYRNDNPYRREACRQLIAIVAKERLPEDIETWLENGELAYVEMHLGAVLPVGCLDLYTLLLAWSHFPAFLNEQGKPGYLTLGLKRMARELGVKNDNIYTWLTILQQNNLVTVGNLDSKFLSQAAYEKIKRQLQSLKHKPEVEAGSLFERAVQTSSMFYQV